MLSLQWWCGITEMTLDRKLKTGFCLRLPSGNKFLNYKPSNTNQQEAIVWSKSKKQVQVIRRWYMKTRKYCSTLGKDWGMFWTHLGHLKCCLSVVINNKTTAKPYFAVNKYKGSDSREWSSLLMNSAVPRIITMESCASWGRSHGECDEEKNEDFLWKGWF